MLHTELLLIQKRMANYAAENKLRIVESVGSKVNEHRGQQIEYHVNLPYLTIQIL